MNWSRWLSARRPVRVRRTRPLLEQLEDRVTPVVFTWSGAGLDASWSNGANWLGGVAPDNSGLTTDLVFPAGAQQTTTTNDTALVYDTITFEAADYVVNGADLTVASIQANNSAGTTNTINSAIRGLDLRVEISSADALLDLTGAVADTVQQLDKFGAGILVLGGDNSVFTGAIDIQQGVLQASRAQALGSAGGAPTIVQNGATLAVVSDASPVMQEALTLNGAGAQAGALRIFGTAGAVQWNAPITLGANATIAAERDLALLQVIGDGGGGFGLTYIGGATVDLPGNTDNTYTGLTSVEHATLLLNKTGFCRPFAGPLSVGKDGFLSEVRWLRPSQLLPVNAAVTVVADSFLNLNDQSDTVDFLTVDDAHVSTGAAGALTVNDLTMTRGVVSIEGLAATLTLNGDLTATSAGANRATIEGPGNLVLGPGTHTIQVDDGPIAEDLGIDGPIVGTGSMLKTGLGRLRLDGTTTLPTVIAAGDVEVNFQVGDIILDGGSVSGTGIVSKIEGPAGSAARGILDPGQNGGSPPGFLLRVDQNAILGPQTEFHVDLDNRQTPPNPPLPGDDHDKLEVTGTASIEGAVLTGTTGAGVRAGDVFTIVRAQGGVTGRFAQLVSGTPVPIAEGDTVALGSGRYTVHYDVDGVVLTRNLTDTAVVVISSGNTLFGQAATFVATVSPLPPGIGTPTGTATFSVDGTAQPAIALVNGQASFTTAGLGVGDHQIGAVYSGDGSFDAGAAAPIVHTVARATVTITLTSTANPAVAGQQAALTAAIASAVPGAGTPTGTVTFTINGAPAGNLAGGAGVLLSRLPPGMHTIRASYSGDANFAPAVTDFVQTIIAVPGGSIVTAIAVGPVDRGPQSSFEVAQQPTDLKLFAFNAEAGQTIAFSAAGLIGTGFDGVLRLFDEAGNQLAFNDDGPVPGQTFSRDAFFEFRFARSGKFFIGVSGFPNLKYNPLDGSGTRAGTTGAYTLTIDPRPRDRDDNDQIREAVILGNAVRARHLADFAIATPTDVDLFRFSAAPGRVVRIVVARPVGSRLAPLIRVFNRGGRELVRGRSGLVTFRVPAGGNFLIGVSGRGNEAYDPAGGEKDRPGSTGDYTIAVTSAPLGDRDGQLAGAASLGRLVRTRRTAALSSAADVDLFQFTAAAGQRVTLEADARQRGLALHLRLFDGNGVEIASGRRIDQLILFAGTYLIGVSSRGNDDYDAVSGVGASAGRGAGAYVLRVTPRGQGPVRVLSSGSSPYSSFGAAAGLVFFDQSGDGQQQAGEIGVGSHTIILDRNSNGVRDDGETAVASDAQGRFLIHGRRPQAIILFAAPLTQFGIPIEKVSSPLSGFHSLSLTRRAVLHRSFGMSRYLG
jgi:autotransporter-associated beta strand protein